MCVMVFSFAAEFVGDIAQSKHYKLICNESNGCMKMGFNYVKLELEVNCQIKRGVYGLCFGIDLVVNGIKGWVNLVFSF